MDFLVLLADVIGVIDVIETPTFRNNTSLWRHPCFGRLKSVNETPMLWSS